MSQHSLTIDNLTAPQVRSNINQALQALASLSSGDTQPPVTFAGMLWLDTSPATPTLRARNAANTGWIEIGELSATGLNIGGRVPQVVSATAPASPTPGMQWVDTGQSPPIVRIRNGANNGWITVASLPDALLRDGSLPMAGPLLIASGSTNGIRVSGNTATWIRQPSSSPDVLEIGTGGVARLTVANAGLQAHVPLTVPAATAGEHAVRLDQIPTAFVRQFVRATHSTNATTTSTAFVSTGASISVTVTSAPCRLLVMALVRAPQWLVTIDTTSGGGGGEGGGDSAEFRLTSSLGDGVSSRISGKFVLPSNIGVKQVGNYQAISVEDFRTVSAAGTYTFTLQMRVTHPSESVSTRANEAAIVLHAWELAP